MKLELVESAVDDELVAGAAGGGGKHQSTFS
jgi:hypothetical protein